MEGYLSVLCDTLSVTVVGLCLVVKLPQIYRVVESQSTEGLSLKSLLMEYWCFSLLLAYPYSRGYQVSTYFEFYLLVIQDFILLIIVLKKKDLLGLPTFGLFGVYLAVVVSLATNSLPNWMTYSLVTTVTPISAASKLIQLTGIIRNQDPGQVSSVSWGMASYTATARCFTILVQTGDVPMLITSLMASVLNTSLFISTIYYRKPDKQKTS